MSIEPPKPKRRWPRALAIAGGAVVVLCLVGWFVIGLVCRSHIASAIKRSTGAELTANHSWYLPPYGVSLWGVRLTRPGPDGGEIELLSAARVDLKLAHLPHKGQPIVVDKLLVKSPLMNLARGAENGKRGESQAAVVSAASAISTAPRPTTAPQRADSSPAGAGAPSTPFATKNSDKFQLHDVEIVDARVRYDNRARGGAEVAELSGIRVLVTGDDAAAGNYSYRVTAADPAGVALNIAGTANVDDLIVQVPELSMKARLAALSPQLLASDARAGKVAPFLKDGTLEIAGRAIVPLRDPQHAAVDVAVTLDGAKADLQRLKMSIDRADAKFAIHGGNKSADGPQPVALAVEKLRVDSGKTALIVDGGTLSVTPDGAGWDLAKLVGRLDVGGGVPALDRVRLGGRFTFTGTAGGPFHLPNGESPFVAMRHEVIAYPRDVSIQPPKFEVPVTHIGGGQICCRGGVVRFQNLIGQYGGDQVLLEDAHITLDDPRQSARLRDLRQQVRIEGMAGTIIFNQPPTPYPAGLGKVIAQLRPTGPFDVGGESWYAINLRRPGEILKPKPDYFFHVSSTRGAFAVHEGRVPLLNIHGDSTVSPMAIDIPKFQADSFDGTVTASVKITPTRPVRYDGKLLLYNVDLDKASAAVQPPDGKRNQLTGRGFADLHITGGGPDGAHTPRQLFAADGDIEIINGDFALVPVVKAAAERVARPNESLVGQAAGVVSVRNEVVVLNNCAVGNPLFGLQGAGTIGFDKTLDLHAVAAPLGDWGDALKQSNIPILDNIAGAIQQLFNGAQRTLLWDLHITGTTSQPQVATIPAPAITEPIAALFGQMLQNKNDTRLIDAVREKPKTQPNAGVHEGHEAGRK
ncbi:MAG: AsmA family [Phycisphaerales bacterium]|nr:AsmA family [Phycisphaerales bacterium]